MTSTLTAITRTAILSNSFDTRLTSLGAVAVLLLLVLLVQKELARAYGGPRSETWVRALNTAIVPLLLMFGYLVAVRLLDILST